MGKQYEMFKSKFTDWLMTDKITCTNIDAEKEWENILAKFQKTTNMPLPKEEFEPYDIMISISLKKMVEDGFLKATKKEDGEWYFQNSDLGLEEAKNLIRTNPNAKEYLRHLLEKMAIENASDSFEKSMYILFMPFLLENKIACEHECPFLNPQGCVFCEIVSIMDRLEVAIGILEVNAYQRGLNAGRAEPRTFSEEDIKKMATWLAKYECTNFDKCGKHMQESYISDAKQFCKEMPLKSESAVWEDERENITKEIMAHANCKKMHIVEGKEFTCLDMVLKAIKEAQKEV